MADLKHFGILGMKWGRRNKVLKPTFQYRDSNGNLVSRYGKGKYGGGKKPDVSKKSDNKFKQDVERLSKKIPTERVDRVSMDHAHNFLKRSSKTPIVTFKENAINAGKIVAGVYGALVVGNFVADKVMWASGAYDRI